MLSFPDGTKVRVIGLDEILAELCSEGRQPTKEIAEEIINRLEAKKNFIPSSVHARREYSYVLLEEYRKYVADRKNKAQGRNR